MASRFTTSNQQLPCSVLSTRLSSNRSRQLVGYGGQDGAIHVYPFAGFSPTAKLDGIGAAVTALSFSPDQNTVVGGSDAGMVRLWDLSSEQCVRAFGKKHTSTVTDVGFHSCGWVVGTVSTDGNMRLWDPRKNGCLQSYKDAKGPLSTIHFSHNGDRVVTGCARGVIRVYDLRKTSLEKTFTRHTGAITSIYMHPEASFIAAGSGDGTVSVWDLRTGECEFQSASVNTPIDSVQFNSNRLLAASDHQLHVYSPSSLSNSSAAVLDAPWTMVGDMAYVSFSDEAWFVECNGATAMTGRLSISTPLSPQSEEPLQHEKPAPSNPLRQQRAPEANRQRVGSPSQGDGADGRAVRKPLVPRPEPRRASPATTRIQPTLPRSERLAAQENYVVQKPGAGNDIPFAHGRARAERPPFVGTGGNAPAPEMPEVPFVDESGSELDVVDQLISSSSSFARTMHRRLTHLRVIRTLWAQDQRAAMEHLRKVCDDGSEAGAVYDFLTAMQQQRMKERMTMEALPDLLDVIRTCLQSSYDALLLVSLRTLRSMNTKFRARVEEAKRRTRMAQSNGYNDPLGVNSANGCISQLASCSSSVAALSGRRDAIGEEARSLLSELPSPGQS